LWLGLSALCLCGFTSSPEDLYAAAGARFDGNQPGSDPGQLLALPKPDVPAPAAPAPVWSSVGAAAGDEIGWTVKEFGDLNGDGVTDFMVGSPAVSFGQVKGEVRIISGKDFSVLKTLHGRHKEDFGYALIPIGDINRDGIPDFIAGIPARGDGAEETKLLGEIRIFSSHRKNSQISYSERSIRGTSPSGYLGRSLVWIGTARHLFIATEPHFTAGTAYAFDAATGKRVYEIEKSPLDFSGENERKGYLAWPVPDLDGDGVTDFVLGAPGQSPDNDLNFPYPGRLYFYSGASGKLLCVLEGEDPTSHIGIGFSAQASQFLVGAPYQSQGQNKRAGAAYRIDPRKLCRPGKPEVLKITKTSDFVLQRTEGSSPNELMGFSFASLPDVNGDGVADYAQGSPGFAGHGEIQILDGRDGKPISELAGDTDNEWFGCQLSSVGPKPRLLVGSPFFSGKDKMSGRVDLYDLINGTPAPAATQQPPK